MTTTSKKPDRFTHKINLFDFLKTIQIFGIHTCSRQKNIVFVEIKTWTELKLTFRLFLSTTFRRVRRFISSTSRLQSIYPTFYKKLLPLYYFAETFQNRTVVKEKQRKTIYYKKAARIMLEKLKPGRNTEDVTTPTDVGVSKGDEVGDPLVRTGQSTVRVVVVVVSVVIVAVQARLFEDGFFFF